MSVRLAGYAALFGVRDQGGDVIRRGAFAGARVPLPLLWQHDPARPVGRCVRIQEDARGLRVLAELAADSAGAAEALALVRGGAATGMSFGYRVSDARPLGGGGRELRAVELIEISIATLPMQPGARVLAVEGVDFNMERIA